MPAVSELSGRDLSVIRRSPFSCATVEEYDRMVKDKHSGRPRERIYPRYGGPELWEQEQRVAGLMGVNPNNLYLTNSGIGAFQLALYTAGLRSGDTVLKGEQLYLGITRSIQRTAKKQGINLDSANSGSVKDIEDAVKETRPKVIILDVADNGTEMALSNVNGILKSDVIREEDPFIIFDNTLPNVDYPVASLLQDPEIIKSKVIFIESGTKAHFCNYDMLGIIYPANENLLQEISDGRSELGYTPSTYSTNTLTDYLAPNQVQFHKEIKTANKNTMVLAQACADTSGAGKLYYIGYPNLVGHPNAAAANEIAPDGIAPVFFIKPEDLSPRDIAEAFNRSGDVDLSESFLFDRTSISYTDLYVRVAGGQESPDKVQEIAECFQQTLFGLKA